MKKTNLCILFVLLLCLLCAPALAEETAIVLDVKGLIPTPAQGYETVPLYVCFDVYQGDTFLGTAAPGEAFPLPEAGEVTLTAQAGTVPSGYALPDNTLVQAQDGVTVHFSVLLTARKGYFVLRNMLTDGTALPGGAFTVLDENGAEVLHFTCDENGSFGPAAALLPEGNYAVRQAWAAEGSVFNENAVSFTLTAPENAQTPCQVTFVNEQVPDGTLDVPDMAVQADQLLPDPKNGAFSFDVSLAGLMPASLENVEDVTLFVSASSPDAPVAFTGITASGTVTAVRCVDENGQQLAALSAGDAFPAGTAGVEVTFAGAFDGSEGIVLHCTAGQTMSDAGDAVLSLRRSWYVSYLNQSGTGSNLAAGGRSDENVQLSFEDGRARLAFDTLNEELTVENVSQADVQQVQLAVLAPAGSLSVTGGQLLRGEETDIALLNLTEKLAPGQKTVLPVSLAAGAQVLVLDVQGSLSARGEAAQNALLDSVWQQEQAKYYVYTLAGEGSGAANASAAAGTLLRGNGGAQAGIVLLAQDEFGSGAYAVTDENGAFAFYGLTEGEEYRLTVFWPEGLWPVQVPETVKTGEQLACTFGQDTILTGTVALSDGSTVQGATVTLFTNGQETAAVTTGETGVYAFTGVKQSGLTLNVTLPGGEIGLPAGSLAMPYTAAYAVDALTAEETNEYNIQAVRLCRVTFEEEKNVCTLLVGNGQDSISLENGQSAFLLPGEYSASYQAEEGYLLSGKETTAFALDEGQQLALTAHAAKAAGVTLALGEQRVITLSGQQQTTSTLQEKNLWPGSYTAAIALAENEYLRADESWQQEGTSASCTFTLAEDEQRVLTAPVILRLGAITGTVSGDSQVTVLAVDENGQMLETVTDSHGWYTFTGLADGSYTLTVRAQNGLAPAPVAKNVIQLDGSGATVAGPDFVMQASAELVVEAFSDDNMNGGRGVYEERLTGLTCQVTDENGNLLATGTTQGADGVVTLSALTPGEVTVKLVLPEGYAFSMPSEKTGRGFSTIPVSAGQETTFKMTLTAGTTSYLTVGMVKSATVCGFAFQDVDGNGIRESGDSMMQGISITALGQKTGLLFTATSGSDGLWQLSGLQPDTYTVTFTAPSDYVFTRYSREGGHDRSILTEESNTASVEMTLKAGGTKDEQNVGFVLSAGISGRVFLDENNNGLMDENEASVQGAVVELTRANSGDVVAKMTTAADGLYDFYSLRTGTYQLSVLLPDDGSLFTGTNAVGENANHFAARAGRRESSLTIALEVGQQVQEQVGVIVPSSISGAVFVDENNSGVMDSAEVLLSGITVTLTGESGTVSTKTVNGTFSFDSLMPGWYTVAATLPDGYVVSAPGEGLFGNRLDESGATAQFWVAMNTSNTYLPLGIIQPAAITGTVYADEDDNGKQNGHDNGTAGVTVQLLNADNTVNAECVTDENGGYRFTGLMPGIYRAEVLLPENSRAVGNDTYSLSQTITLTMGQAYTARAVGILRYCTVDLAFTYHGSPLGGTAVTFTRGDGVTFTQTAEKDGRVFTNTLLPGTYVVSVAYPDGLIPSGGLAGVKVMEMYQGRVLSIGQETCVPASVAGKVFYDENDNGMQEDEPAAQGMTLTLTDTTGAQAAQTVSAADGSYAFESLLPGDYTVTIAIDGATITCDMQALAVTDLQEGENRDGLSFALVRYGQVQGQAYLLTADQPEMLPGFAVTLTGQTAKGTVSYQAYTNEAGGYAFTGLRPGSYTISAKAPDNRVFLLAGDEDFLGNTSVMTSQQSSDPMTLDMGGSILADVGLLIPAKIGDIAFLDNNRNGLYDSAEDETIPGLNVRLVRNGETVAETITNEYGYYLFENVYPGSYTIEADALDGLGCTEYRIDYPLMASCLISQQGSVVSSGSIFVTSGEKNFNCDLGFVLEAGAKKPAQIVPGHQQKWAEE